jgi:hypothetical protein
VTLNSLKHTIKRVLHFLSLTPTVNMQNDNMDDILLDIEEYRTKELIDYYVEDLERLAAENQVTVDYYIAEFT